MKEYVIFLAQQHPTFRVAELRALADLYKFEVDLSGHDEKSPFLIVRLENDDQASKLVSRGILSRGIYELWGVGDTEEELHQDVKRRSSHLWEKYNQCTFKFDVLAYKGKRSNVEKIRLIERFGYLDFHGAIRMKNPDQVFTILEHYTPPTEHDAAELPSKYYFGREVELSGRSRGVLEKYDLKKRKYIGTTTFEAELALVTCNLAHCVPGSIMYDPFVGTGSFLVAGAHYGCLTVGSDIDGRLIKGKGNANIKANFKQYGMPHLFMDVLTMDFTHNALRDDLVIDTIVCDPPYGIREGLKVLGAKNPERFEGKENIEIDGEKAYLKKDYIPTKKPYELDSLLYDLLEFASRRLPIGGRLAFWMPTANDNFEPTIIPLHRNLELKHHLVQEFNKWSRRLLVYVNHGDGYNGEENRAVTMHQEFRKMYFRSRRGEGTTLADQEKEE
ncbi:tRNA (guanine-N2-)-methyltransferase [Cyberlindnera jadinii NRRL Y-1542]|uniref:tRNA (guanine(10)-N(2))-methyltransferase n=1 Tax=Cyberlindnera jadinii (strain ATCC 18201 / CBS 1600 / BCRC 20928 / JCM 3617 / NBRC 0987 / NRRL Y-1542) TaxID=983966 RepID=A0A1E4S5V4_CYBJN|nr:tRNA guanosine-2'-O-methyltransferase [Cyberlindnera jadinii NRRL Y-1542]ODV74906.1 tRNA guanosine-2'-O-methyltransferase [Cyberlindnera jadinii NRRL Y-1542]